LKPGDTVGLAIKAETIQNTVIVPAAALLNSDTGGQRVMVVDGGSVAHARMVTVGVRQGDRVQILSGVQEHERAVVSGALGLEDKAKVAVEQPKSEEDEDEDAGKDDAKGKE
jgi:multidrug efflux system membrane fusion protein